MNYFVNNREIIKNISFNTGTSSSEVWTPICTTSEVELTTDLEVKDFYVFCDAIKRQLVTGAGVSLDTTIKLDINNVAIQGIIGKIHTLIVDGEVAQFNNVEVQFELLENVSNNVLSYKKYSANATLNFSDLGGSAEDEGEFALEIMINGKASAVAA